MVCYLLFYKAKINLIFGLSLIIKIILVSVLALCGYIKSTKAFKKHVATIFLGDGKSQMHIQILIIVFNKINQLSYTLINNNKRIIKNKKDLKKIWQHIMLFNIFA